MWASQLLILENTARPFVEVNFKFSEEVYVGRVEVVAFNCAMIKVRRNYILGVGSIIGQSNIINLDSLVRICFPLDNTLNATALNVRFFSNERQGFDGVYLAEVAFYTNSTCPQANTFDDCGDSTTSDSNYTIIIVVCILCVMLLVVCVVVVVFFLWRHGRLHKHSITHNTTPSSDSNPHPPSTLCGETGQFYAQINKDTKDIDQLYDEVDIKRESRKKVLKNNNGAAVSKRKLSQIPP